MKDNICADCKKPIASRSEAAIDHIIPLSRGGTHEDDNLRLVHWACHRKTRWYTRLWWAISDRLTSFIVWHRALLHEIRCAECRVSWKSWRRRLVKDPRGMNPKRYG